MMWLHPKNPWTNFIMNRRMDKLTKEIKKQWRRTMIEIALVAVLTCAEAKELVHNARNNDLLRPPQHEQWYKQ